MATTWPAFLHLLSGLRQAHINMSELGRAGPGAGSAQKFIFGGTLDFLYFAYRISLHFKQKKLPLSRLMVACHVSSQPIALSTDYLDLHLVLCSNAGDAST